MALTKAEQRAGRAEGVLSSYAFMYLERGTSHVEAAIELFADVRLFCDLQDIDFGTVLEDSAKRSFVIKDAGQ